MSPSSSCPRLYQAPQPPIETRWIDFEDPDMPGMPHDQTPEHGETDYTGLLPVRFKVSAVIHGNIGSGRMVPYCGKGAPAIDRMTVSNRVRDNVCTTEVHKDCPIRHELEAGAHKAMEALKDLTS